MPLLSLIKSTTVRRTCYCVYRSLVYVCTQPVDCVMRRHDEHSRDDDSAHTSPASSCSSWRPRSSQTAIQTWPVDSRLLHGAVSLNHESASVPSYQISSLRSLHYLLLGQRNIMTTNKRVCVCLAWCLLAYLRTHISQVHLIFCPCWLWPWLHISQAVCISVFTARRYTKSGICRRRVSVCVHVSVCLSVTLQYCIKTAKHRITRIKPHDSPETLVIWHQSS